MLFDSKYRFNFYNNEVNFWFSLLSMEPIFIDKKVVAKWSLTAFLTTQKDHVVVIKRERSLTSAQ